MQCPIDRASHTMAFGNQVVVHWGKRPAAPGQCWDSTPLCKCNCKVQSRDVSNSEGHYLESKDLGTGHYLRERGLVGTAKREGVYVKSYPYERGGGGKVLAMLKGEAQQVLR